MADKLTPQQEMAVTSRGGKLLVSAAAVPARPRCWLTGCWLSDPDA